ncbi:hypothetical protein AB0F43_29815 [Kribbella sp. NPDC023972]|uniref:hypothetical protein n=1 Tax=Kribbella sp. NPDC023972 TaxID=3154795 RepID=UPI0033F45576
MTRAKDDLHVHVNTVAQRSVAYRNSSAATGKRPNARWRSGSLYGCSDSSGASSAVSRCSARCSQGMIPAARLRSAACEYACRAACTSPSASRPRPMK